MSVKHPIIAVTGSSGAGTSTVKAVFQHLFKRLHIRAAYVEGDSFHRYTRREMHELIALSTEFGARPWSLFGPEANLLPEMAALFHEYGQQGSGRYRRYLHEEDEAKPYAKQAGEFTDWFPLPPATDVLLYEGLHGAVQVGELDLAREVDLLIGVVPIINLEWIQKIHRDTAERGYSREAVMDSIVRRMHDYVHYIVPQFSRTHINFQRVPTVDTSNPFTARDIPTADESFVVIRFHRVELANFPYLLQMLAGSFMSRHNTLVVPGGKMQLAMELILTPILTQLRTRQQAAQMADMGA